MNFREFVNSDRKPQYKEPEPIYEDVDDQEDYIDEPEEDPNGDYEDGEEGDEEYYEEPEPSKVIPPTPQRVAQRPVQRVPQRPRPVQRPVPQRVVRPQPQYRPVRQAMPVEQYNRPIQINKKQLTEDTIEGTANSLTEALKRKVDTIFYRFGIQGLEKLDEKILDTIEELQYPDAKQIKKPGVNMRRVPAKRIVRKPKPIQLEEVKPVPQYVPEEEYYEEPAPVYEEQEPMEEMVEEPIQEEVQEPVEQKPQTMENILEGMGNSMRDIAGQLLNIDPAKELKHEPKGNNPVFAPPTPMPVRTPSEPKEVPIALEVLPVENQFIQMPDLTETKQETPTETPTEEPVEQPVEKPKKTRKSKKKEEEVTNEEK